MFLKLESKLLLSFYVFLFSLIVSVVVCLFVWLTNINNVQHINTLIDNRMSQIDISTNIIDNCETVISLKNEVTNQIALVESLRRHISRLEKRLNSIEEIILNFETRNKN